MIEMKSHDFSIWQIANSGQCFRINRFGAEDVWEVRALGKTLKIQRAGEHVHIFHCSPEEYGSIWEDYFDLKRDYGEIRELILKTGDQYLRNAVACGFGIRILRQDTWEVAVSFIISQRNSIPRIKSTVEKLCAPCGGLFPSPHALAGYGEEFLRAAGLGYRARYLLELAKAAESGEFDVEYLKTLSCEDAISYVKRFNGIGEKVANCIALYGLHKLEAFPVDTWVRRIIDGQYGGKFDNEQFRKYAGVAQQYMFFYERSLEEKFR